MLRTLSASVVLVVGCTQTATAPAPPPEQPIIAAPELELEPEPSAMETSGEARGRFRGSEVGAEYALHGASSAGGITLAPGLERQSMVRFADGWVYIVAREGGDMVVLLVDERGIVADDITLVGLGDHLAIADCDADKTLALVDPKACEDAQELSSKRAWTHEASGLRELEQPPQCWCDLVDL